MKIEKDVPIPQRRGIYKEALSKIQNGDSVVVESRGKVQWLMNSAQAIGFSVVTRKQDDGSIRVWFLKKGSE